MSELIPDEFWQAVEQFNQREFYACHDTLEALWVEASDPQRNFYQGVLQIAVALYHLGNHNWRGAVILLGEGISRLRHYQPAHFDIDVERLIIQSAQLLSELQQAGPERVSEFVPVGNEPHDRESNSPERDRFALTPLQLPRILKLPQ